MALTKTPIELSSTPSIVDGGNATAITIDSSENVLVGKTDTSIGVAGSRFISNGQVQATASGQEVLLLNRLSSDGELLNFRKDSTTVGQINSRSSDMVIGTGDTGLQFYDAGNSIFPLSASGNTNRDAVIDLGETSNRFKDLYLSGGAYLGGTGAANKLEDYETGTFTPTIVAATGNQPTITYTTNTGTYTKVGKLVTLVGIVQIATISGTTSGNLNITGLPFTQISGDGNAACGTFSPNGMNFARTEFGSVSQYQTPTLGFLTQNNNSGWSWEQVNILSAGDSFRFSISYLTTA